MASLGFVYHICWRLGNLERVDNGFVQTQAANNIFVDYGLIMWGRDQSWWATFAYDNYSVVFDILVKVFKFMFKPNDDELFRIYEKDLELKDFSKTRHSENYIKVGLFLMINQQPKHKF